MNHVAKKSEKWGTGMEDGERRKWKEQRDSQAEVVPAEKRKRSYLGSYSSEEEDTSALFIFSAWSGKQRGVILMGTSQHCLERASRFSLLNG